MAFSVTGEGAAGRAAVRSRGEEWARRWWMEGAIVLVALAFRMWALELKPPHFDEGVNGWFVDEMTKQGYYHYDPANFHGPLHFYLLFLSQTLFGRYVWALRLPVVLASVGAVVLALGYRRFLPVATCRLAALAMALSPAMTFYGRYAIHESELLAFLMLTVWGVMGLRKDGDFRSLAAAALGATGCVLTKETYAIHFVAMVLGFPAVWAVERVTRTPGVAWARQRWMEWEGPVPRDESDAGSGERPFGAEQRRDAAATWERPFGPSSGGTLQPHGRGRSHGRVTGLMVVCVGAIVFFYSGNFLDGESLRGIVTTFHAWVGTGVDPNGGHNKEWYYWLELLARYEAPAALGVACLWLPLVVKNWNLRYLTATGAAAFIAYSAVRYKTPWCVISMMWPFLFLFGEAVRLAASHLDKWLAGAVAALALGHSAVSAWLLNFRNETNEEEPYVYVQTLPAIHRVLDPLRWLVAHDPARRFLHGYMLFSAGEGHPLQWLLADYTQIKFLGESDARPEMDAEILLIEAPYVADVEDRLHETYFREELVLRGSGATVMLYLRASTFAPLFPERTPEFTLAPADSAPTKR